MYNELRSEFTLTQISEKFGSVNLYEEISTDSN
jgi:hypothetical protein